MTSLKLAAAANLAAGRTARGDIAAPATVTQRETITSIDPLESAPVTGGPAAALSETDATKGAAVGDVVIVQQTGSSTRIAVALAAPKTITESNAGEQVATVNGKTVSVGGTVTLDNTDVNALADTTRAVDIGGAGQTHYHINAGYYVASSSSVSQIPGNVSGTPSASDFNNLLAWARSAQAVLTDIKTSITVNHETSGPQYVGIPS
ncbi:MAG: hypothetical protein WAX29_09240 [Propionibacterium sp.]